MKLNTLLIGALIAASITAGNLQAADQALPEVTIEGLRHVSDTELAIVYAKPDADLSQ